MEYEIKVYRTVTQSISIIKEGDKQLTATERGYIRMVAEDEAAEMSDHEWKDENSDIEYTWTELTPRNPSDIE